MNQLSFLDKIHVLFELLFSSPIVIGIFAFSLILMVALFFSSKLNKKFVKYIFISIYVLIIGFSIFKYGSYFLTSIDSFLTLFMANIYFPIIPIYVAIMIISFIIMIVTLSGRNKSRIVKIINTVFFTLIQMLFAVFIYTIESNNIDLSSNTGLYSNEQTMTLLELGMGLFVVWIVLLLVILYLKKADKIFKTKKVEDQNDFDEYINDYNEPIKVVKPTAPVNVISANNGVPILVPETSGIDVTSDDIALKTDVQNNVEVNIIPNLVPEVNTVNSVPNLVPEVDTVNSVPNLSSEMSSSIDSVEEVLSFEDDYSNDISNNVPSSSFINDIANGSTVNNNMSVNNQFIKPINTVSEPKKNSNNPTDIFSSFQFLDVPREPIERRNDDVEIIDFD